jgi:hypothetical protein
MSDATDAYVINLEFEKCQMLLSMTQQWVLPEYGCHALLSATLLVAWQPVLFLLNVPLIVWHVRRYMNRPAGMSEAGVYDPTDVFNR